MTSHSISSITGDDSAFRHLFVFLYDFSPLDMDLFVNLLNTSSAKTLEDLAKELDRDKSTIFKSLQRLVSLGLCTKEVRNLREGGYYHLYKRNGIENISKNTRMRVEEVQSNLSKSLKKFDEELNRLALVRSLRILIAEDETDVAISFKMTLEDRGHKVILTKNGKDCVDVYMKTLDDKTDGRRTDRNPFDVVLLDYRMPKMNGMEVAKEILSVNPAQRIVFASAYAKDTLVEAIAELKQVVELLQKPFDSKALIETVEDTGVQENLKRLMVNLTQVDPERPDSQNINDLYGALRLIQKARTF